MIWPFLATLWLSPLADVPSTQAIQAAIQSLAPRRVPAKKYARIIHREARRRNIDPFLIVAIIHVESSWNSRAKSPTADWGLGQVHVSKTSNPELIGKEYLLFDPNINIDYVVKTLVMWRAYHRRCAARVNTPSQHPWWSHYQWGYVVRDLTWSKKVTALYHALRQRAILRVVA
jgi:soluble lytic murein transglycosylase-like protein